MSSKPEKSKRFKYNLKTLLKVREIHEKQEEEKFSQAQKKLQEEERKEREIKRFQNEKYSELRQRMEPGQKISNFQEILMRKSHLEIVKEQVEEQIQKREDAERMKEQQRLALAKAAMERKVIEKDKEKKKTLWKKFMNKEEEKFIDDLSTIAFVRKNLDNKK